MWLHEQGLRVAVIDADEQASASQWLSQAAPDIAVLPELLEADERIARDLDRCNRAHLSLEVGDLHVEALLQDHTAKLPVPMLIEQAGGEALHAALTELAGQLPLPPTALRRPAPDLQRTGCLDDLFSEPADHDLYGNPDSTYAWTRYVTPIGRAIHACRADAAVLEAALIDLRFGLSSVRDHDMVAQHRQNNAHRAREVV